MAKGGLTVEQRPLGRTGRTISGIGLGCVTFGAEIDEEASYRVMDYALEQGITFFDTAESYGGGQRRRLRKEVFGIDDVREVSDEYYSSERIVGTWMHDRGCRDEITLCTKVSTGGSPENIAKALSASLERLRTDRVDIYKMHSPDTSTPIEETLSALDAEVEAGRVGVMGGSNYSASQLREALDASASAGYHRFEVQQPAYSLVRAEAGEDLFALCREESIAVTPYSPLAAGFLSGKYTPDRTTMPRGTRLHMSPGHADMYLTDRNFRIVDRLRAKAEELGTPMVRLAMAWAMTHADVTSTLIGTTDHIDNALRAYTDGLDPELRAEMSAWE